MRMHEAAVPPFMKNGFVLACERTREAVYIDPGDEVEDLLAVVERERLDVKHILLTHAHVDHVSGVPQAKGRLNVPVHLHRDDLFLYNNAVTQGTFFGLRIQPLPAIDRFYDNTIITFGDYEVSVHHTPGHCPGGVCLAVTYEPAATHRADTIGTSTSGTLGTLGTLGTPGTPGTPGTLGTPGTPSLFVGDTLFAGSIGRTDLPGGNYETLMQSITKVLFAFGDDAPVFSGHGPETTIGRERRSNPFVLEWMARR